MPYSCPGRAGIRLEQYRQRLSALTNCERATCPPSPWVSLTMAGAPAADWREDATHPAGWAAQQSGTDGAQWYGGHDTGGQGRRGVSPMRAWLLAYYGALVSLSPLPRPELTLPRQHGWTDGGTTRCLLTIDLPHGALTVQARTQTGPAAPHGLSPTPHTLPGEGMPPTTESVRAPILGRARKLAGLWVTADNGQSAYLDWMEFCEDWARYRLKQTYFERLDVNAEPPRERVNPSYLAQWEWENAPDPPPRRTSAQLDQMAHDICEEAWDQGRNLREVLVALVRRLHQGALLPAWFYQAVVAHNAP